MIEILINYAVSTRVPNIEVYINLSVLEHIRLQSEASIFLLAVNAVTGVCIVFANNIIHSHITNTIAVLMI